MPTETKTDIVIGSIAVIEPSQIDYNHMVLQPILYNLIALGRVLKQLHWNVTGLHFRPIHLHLDEIYEFVDSSVDEVAERLVATGHSPNGRFSDISEHSELQDVPTGFIKDSRVLFHTEQALRKTIEFMRARTTEIETVDTATADMLHQLILGLEKHHWMIEAQRI